MFTSNLIGEGRPFICLDLQVIWVGRMEGRGHMFTSNLVWEGRGHSYVHK